MANTRLEKTFTASNRKTFTISTWIKRSALTANNHSIYGAGTNDSTDRDYLAFLADAGEEDKLYFQAKVSSSVVAQFYTNRRFRDISGWYNIVLAFDTTQATDTNRMKLYVNGELQTFQSVTYPNQNRDMNTNNTVHKIGSTVGNSYYFDGSMSHFHFIDGTAYAASTFGSTDSTTGEWKINASPSVTYGTNGFFVLKDGNTITDSSSNSNNFTLGGGTLTKTEDCPDNVFCTMNPLDNYYTVHTFTNGNTTVIAPSSGYSGVIGAMGASTGKYYFEFKPVSKTGDADEYIVGIVAETVKSVNQPQSKMATGYMYLGSNGYKYNNDTGSSYGNTFTAGDIIGVAMDLDNRKIYFSKNGTWQNSGNPESGATGTGAAFTLTAPSSTEIGFYLPCCAFFSNSAGANMAFNFGNGFFGTTAVSSAGTNASGIGIFEYDVPANFTAISTKGLNL